MTYGIGRTCERRHHARWTMLHGQSPLNRLGDWLYLHRGQQLSSAPQDLLAEALRDVTERLPMVAAREPTKRHRNHFSWLLGWHARLTAAIGDSP